MKKMKGNSKIIARIAFILMFAIFSTVFIYMPKKTDLASSFNFLNNYKSFKLNSISEDINLSAQYPVKDEVGLNGEATVFEIVNTSKKSIDYNIILKTDYLGDEYNYLDLTNLRYSISINDSEYSKPMNVKEDGIISVYNIPANSTIKYSLKLWVDYNCDNSVYGSLFAAYLLAENI